jgi:hypothetical protein
MKQFPIVFSTNDYFDETEKYNITLNNFNFFISMHHKNYNYLMNPVIVKSKIFLKLITSKKRYNNTVSVEISFNLKNETVVRHFSNYLKLLQVQSISNMYWYNPIDSEKVYLQGSIGSTQFASDHIQMKTCKNDTDIILNRKKK